MPVFWKAKLFFLIHLVALQLVLLLSLSIKNIVNSNIFSSSCQGHDEMPIFRDQEKTNFLMLIEILSTGEAFLNVQEVRQEKASKT